MTNDKLLMTDSEIRHSVLDTESPLKQPNLRIAKALAEAYYRKVQKGIKTIGITTFHS